MGPYTISTDTDSSDTLAFYRDVYHDINKLNYYNNLIPAYKISKSEEFNTNPMFGTDIGETKYYQIYRHSGYYMPIFYEIDLFKRPSPDVPVSRPKRYKTRKEP